MPVTALSIKGYRSIRSIQFPIEELTVLVGTNGVGKTNLYRALELLHFAAKGTITHSVAEEGGMESVLWSGQRKINEPLTLVLEAELGELGYKIEIGLPVADEAALPEEPLVKYEEVNVLRDGKRVAVMKREGPAVHLKNDADQWLTNDNALLASETALSSIRDGAFFPEMDAVRREMADWRFYHNFRTDESSPLRQPALAICTPTLSSSGHDLAAVLATVYLIKEDPSDILAAVEDAFPGSKLILEEQDGKCILGMEFTDMPRPFKAHELSDGTLNYLSLVGALLGYRLPSFIALNEPENSLHPDLIEPLARLISQASKRTRIWVVTHSEHLATEIARQNSVTPRIVEKIHGSTYLKDMRITGTISEKTG